MSDNIDIAALLSTAVVAIAPDAPSVDPAALFAPSPSPSHSSTYAQSVLSSPSNSADLDMLDSFSVSGSTGTEKPSKRGAAPRQKGGKRKVLTPEERAVKAHERIMKNRAAAQDSRDRKRKYVTDLESTNSLLRAQNDALLQRVQALEASNQLLTARLNDQINLVSSLLPVDLVSLLALNATTNTAGTGEPAALPDSSFAYAASLSDDGLREASSSQQRIQPWLLLLTRRISVLAALIVHSRRQTTMQLIRSHKARTLMARTMSCSGAATLLPRASSGLPCETLKEGRDKVGVVATGRVEKPCGWQALKAARAMGVRHGF